MARPIMEAARASQCLAAARRAIEALAAALRTALGDGDPDRRAAAAKRAVGRIAAAAGRPGRVHP